MKLSLVVPCFNEEAALPQFHAALTPVLAEIAAQGFASEIIFIDDGSRDQTATTLATLQAADARVRTVIFSRNFGKEAALLAGMERARGDFVATLDCDLQDPPSLLPSMLATVQSGEFDCVGTRRVTRAGEPAVRSFFARAFYRGMRYFAEVEIVDGARDFRLMNRQYVTAILSLRERRRFSKGLFPWVGFRVKWVEYENITRVAGETKWSFWRLFLYAFDGITAFSTKPLAVAVFLGGFMCLLSVCGIFTVVIRKFIYDDSAYGWASAMCIFLFVSGVQLFATGMVGEYLAKVYAEVKQRPHYLVREEK